MRLIVRTSDGSPCDLHVEEIIEIDGIPFSKLAKAYNQSINQDTPEDTEHRLAKLESAVASLQAVINSTADHENKGTTQ